MTVAIIVSAVGIVNFLLWGYWLLAEYFGYGRKLFLAVSRSTSWRWRSR